MAKRYLYKFARAGTHEGQRGAPTITIYQAPVTRAAGYQAYSGEDVECLGEIKNGTLIDPDHENDTES